MGHKLKLHSNRVEKFCLCPVLSYTQEVWMRVVGLPIHLWERIFPCGGGTFLLCYSALVGVTTIDDLGRTKVVVKRAESQGRGGGDPRRRVGFGCHGLLGSKDLNPISKRDQAKLGPLL
ncbi:hypothetical protein CK203_038855 [Vitis vinifera]|uniref:DUF4283 domain-containing protein n=1 Tax=Vitis vinifera TaxID=29760 RepID=A0A438I1T5_VITVI|nr:hypothetical protein CK203_038855 [Vitis vinifera]